MTMITFAQDADLQLDIEALERAVSGNDWVLFLQSHPSIWAALVALLCTILLALMFLNRHQHDRETHRPAARRLANSLGMTAAQQQLLEEIATSMGLSNPGPLLISQGCFDAAVRVYPKARSHGQAIRTLRKTIFDNA